MTSATNSSSVAWVYMIVIKGLACLESRCAREAITEDKCELVEADVEIRQPADDEDLGVGGLFRRTPAPPNSHPG